MSVCLSQHVPPDADLVMVCAEGPASRLQLHRAAAVPLTCLAVLCLAANRRCNPNRCSPQHLASTELTAAQSDALQLPMLLIVVRLAAADVVVLMRTVSWPLQVEFAFNDYNDADRTLGDWDNFARRFAAPQRSAHQPSISSQDHLADLT